MGSSSSTNKNSQPLPIPIKAVPINHDTFAAESTNGSIFLCNSCKNAILPRMVRYYCNECQDFSESYDMCEWCYQNATHPHPLSRLDVSSIVKSFKSQDLTASGIIENVFMQFRERRLFGFLPPEELSKPKSDRVLSYLSYQAIGVRVFNLSSGLLALNPDRKLVALCGENSVEWYTSDYACILNRIPTTPVHITYDDSILEFLLNHSLVFIAIISNSQLPRFLKISERCPSIKYVISMDNAFDSSREPSNGLKFFSISELEELGREKPILPKHLAPEENKDQVTSILYTSGSTGRPKGTVMTEYRLRQRLRTNIGLTPLRVISYMPLAHGMQRSSDYAIFGKGGCIVLFNQPMECFYDFLPLARPVMLGGVPRVWNVLFEQYKTTKHLALKNVPKEKKAEVKKQILRELSASLGNSLRLIDVGGAPSSQKLQTFLDKLFPHSMIVEGYGATEVGAIAQNGRRLPECQIRLVDVPEMGYTSSQTPFRGELWVKTPLMAINYFKDDQNTFDNFKDGYFCTGDIVEYDPKTEHLRVIDRRKNFIKLSQGEFVTPDYLESIYFHSIKISSIWIHASGLQSFILAVVIPNKSYAINWANEQDIQDKDFETICRNEKFKEDILLTMQEIGKKKGLQQYEIPLDVHLEFVEFSPENGLCTPSNKLNRVALAKFYSSPLKDLYKKHNTSHKKALLAQTITSILSSKQNSSQIQLQQPSVANNINKPQTLKEKGLDSLSAVQLQSALRDRLNLNVSIASLLNPNLILDDLVESLSSDSYSHGPSEIDWLGDSQVPPEIFEKSRSHQVGLENSLDRFAQNNSAFLGRNVFLTGATGFLGGFLLAELLKRETVGTIYCLVRSTSLSEARDRLIKSLDEKLLKSENLPLSRIVAIPGDLAQPFFGLNEKQFEEVADSIDCILHNGAHVNGVHPYISLRDSNVCGTRTALLLATTGKKLKSLIYISSLSALGAAFFLPENERLNLTESTELISMSGYGSSKRVAETLVRNARDEGLIPAIIVRPGMIGWHSFLGTANPDDFDSRLIVSISKLRSVPCIDSPVEMAPVDQVSEFIVGAGLLPMEFFYSKTKPIAVMNLQSLDNGLTLKVIGEGVRNNGVKVDEISFHDWRELVRHNDQVRLYPLRHYFDTGFPVPKRCKDENTQNVFKELGFQWKKLDHHYTQRALEYLSRFG